MVQLFPNKFHLTFYKVQSKSSATCGLHTVYFIVRMTDPKNKSKYTETIDLRQYTRSNYDVKEAGTKLKDQDIVNIYHINSKQTSICYQVKNNKSHSVTIIITTYATNFSF